MKAVALSLALSFALLLAWLAAPATAQDPAEGARDAARALEAASVGLDQADSARDRVAALTETVRAYEDGLAAMREGLRAAAVRELALTRRLQAQEGEIARLLGVLTALGGQASPESLVHPSGPLGTARAGLLVASVTPALNDRARALRADLEEVTMLRRLQESAAETLRDGLTGVQAARTALSQAIADRAPLPRRFTEDPVRTALLIEGTETLEGFASGLAQISGDTDTAPGDADPDRPMPLPVRGTLLRAAGETDAAGVTRPGIVVATRPGALVTVPAASTVRYAGPLLDYGLVAILEPREGLLFVFAGLDAVYGETGQVLPAGDPLGLMGGSVAGGEASPSGEEGGAQATETLYMEVREGDRPVDPLRWFATG